MRLETPPHGGKLVNRIASPEEAAALRERGPHLKKIHLPGRRLSDLEMIAVGAFSPLEGFLGRADYENVVVNKRLANGLPWTIPITLAVTQEEAEALSLGEEIALVDKFERVVAIFFLEEKYAYDREREARLVYGTTDERHPGVRALYRRGGVYLGGKITLLERPYCPEFLLPYRLDPADTRRIFAERGWRRVVGFQTRNPVHRAHEYIQKCALETMDGLLLHPLVGETKKDDLPAEVRLKCYQVLLKAYYPRDRVLLAVLPAVMRYAGPREAIFHALVRKNYGCSHFIVGRDHAGVGDYYGPYDAHYIFDEFTEEELGIVPLFFDHTFYCRECGGMASGKTCPHEETAHLTLSGTKLRALLQAREIPPPEITRPEVAQVLLEALGQKGREIDYGPATHSGPGAPDDNTRPT